MFGRENKMSGKLEMHEDACKLVMDVFRSMGGTVLPPKRPRHIPRYTPHTIDKGNFYMDFENACLSQNWDSRKRPHPKGTKRHKDPESAAMIQSQVFPNHSDIDWEEYMEWVESGGGDKRFQEEEDDENNKWQTERRDCSKSTIIPAKLP